MNYLAICCEVSGGGKGKELAGWLNVAWFKLLRLWIAVVTLGSIIVVGDLSKKLHLDKVKRTDGEQDAITTEIPLACNSLDTLKNDVDADWK